MLKYMSIEKNIIIFVVVFSFITLLTPTFDRLIDIEIFLTVSTFLFGIFSGFFIANRWGRYSRMKTLLTNETGDLISIYKISKLIGNNFSKKISDIIDNYLIETFKYEVYEYHEKTEKFFYEIFNQIEKIKPKTHQQKEATGLIMWQLKDMPRDREELFLLGRSKMPKFMFPIIWFLAFVIIFCLFYIRISTIASSIITILLSTCVVLVILVLRDLNNLKWGERSLAFEIYHRVFDAIDKLRVYPDISIKKGRIEAPEDRDYRLGIFEEKNGKQYFKNFKMVKKGTKLEL